MRLDTHSGQPSYIVLISKGPRLFRTTRANCQEANVCSSTTITLLHRTQMYSRRHCPEDGHHSSKIAFRAAGMITAIVRALASHDELSRCPGIMYAPSLIFCTSDRSLIVIKSLQHLLRSDRPHFPHAFSRSRHCSRKQGTIHQLYGCVGNCFEDLAYCQIYPLDF